MIDPHFQEHARNLGFIISSLKGGSYLGIFLLSIFVSYIIPLPEAVLLLLVGFVAKTTGINLWSALAVCTGGVIVGDNLLYRLSFFGNKYVEKFNRKMRQNKLIRYEHLVVDHIGATIYFLRFITGVRFFGPVIAGTLGVRWKKFFLHNAIATIFHTAFFVLLGYYLNRRIISTITTIEIIRNAMFFSSAIIVGILISFFTPKEKKN